MGCKSSTTENEVNPIRNDTRNELKEDFRDADKMTGENIKLASERLAEKLMLKYDKNGDN